MSISAGVSVMVSTESLDDLILRMTALDAVVAKYGALVLQSAQRLVAVDTGALKASIRLELEAMTATIIAGEGLTYAAAQEYGDARQPGTAFMRPSIERYADAFLAEVQAVMNGG